MASKVCRIFTCRFNRDDLLFVFNFLIDSKTIMRKQKLHRIANYLKKLLEQLWYLRRGLKCIC